jgi:hypothetical protein
LKNAQQGVSHSSVTDSEPQILGHADRLKVIVTKLFEAQTAADSPATRRKKVEY